MGTNRLGQELVQCVNRAKPSSKEVIQVFGSVIKAQSLLINDGLFSNYDLIQQNKLTSMVVSDYQAFTPVIYFEYREQYAFWFQETLSSLSWCFHQISQPISRFVYLHAPLHGHGQSREADGFSS